MFDRDEDGYDSMTIWIAVALAIVAMVAMTVFAFGADNDQPCYTREQAREKFPGQYLFWRTANHCWYGRPRVGRANLHPNPKSRSVRPDVQVVRWNEYNSIDAQADRDVYFDTGTPVPVWRLAPIPKSKFPLWDERIGM